MRVYFGDAIRGA